MATWIFSTISLLSISILSSCLLLVESRPIQQVLSPIYDTECEFDALEHYSEQCGSTTVTLPTCNTGYRRIWWCEAGTNGFPEGFDPYHDACGNCPPNTYQSRYNKCRTCHPCSQCEQGQIVEKACEMDHDTVCRSVEPTSSLPFAPPLDEGTPLPSEKVTLDLDLSSALNPSEEHSVWSTNWTDPTKESFIEAPIAVPRVDFKMEFWLYRAFIMVLILLLVGALFGWRKECLRRKKLQALAPENDIQLSAVNKNGAAPRSGDGEHDAETDALLGEEHPNEDKRRVRNQATSNSGANAATGNHLPASSPGNARNLGSDGASGSTSDNTSCTADEGSIDGAHGTGAEVPVDGAIGTLGGTSDGASDSGTDGPSCTDTDGAISSTNDSPTDSSSLPKYINCGAMCGSAADGANDGTTIGAVLSDGESLTQYDSPSETDGDGMKSCTNHTDNGAVLLGDGIPLPVDEIPHDITVHPMDGDTRDTTRDHIHSSQDEAPFKSRRDGTNETTSDNIDGTTALGGDQTSTDTSTDGTINTEEVSARDGACGPPSDGVDDDVRRANPATQKVDPGIKADDVVTTQFLQHVAQEISHSNSKTICRMLGLRERDIDDVETLTHKDEQGFEFLKKLLGRIGKDLTYRSVINALIKCKNKNHADNLVVEFKIS